MAVPMPRLHLASSPSKRKRSHGSFYCGELSDVESCDVRKSPSRTKKARLLFRTDSEECSNMDTPSTPSLIETASATINDTESPITEASSVRGRTRIRPKKYVCNFAGCGKAFDRPIRLQTHVNSHTGERPHVCTEQGCDKKFFKAEHLKQHIHDKHTDYSGFECSFQLHDSLSGCLVKCGKTFPTSTKLKRHIAQHEQKEETTCSWEGCGKVFRKQETLQRHIKKDHLEEMSYQCLSDIPEGGICGQFFATPGQLRGHKAQAHDAPKFWCDLCIEAMDDDTHDNDTEENIATPYMTDLEAPERDLDDGILRTLDPRDAVTPSMHVRAGSAGFATYAEFQFHMREYHPPTCAECGKPCKSNRELTAHIDIEHPHLSTIITPKEEKQFPCPFEGCSRAEPGAGFAKKGNMVVHFKTVHAKERAFTCGEYDLGSTKKTEGWNGQGCGAALKTKQALIAHIRTQHLGVPAATGAKTGLRDQDRKRRVRSGNQKIGDDWTDLMEVDTEPVPHESGAAISLLTGAGYEMRPFACLLAQSHGCEMRFVKPYDLSYHMEMSHGWNVDDINDAMQSINPLASAADQEQVAYGDSELDLEQHLKWKINAMQRSDQQDALDPRLKGSDVS